MAKRPEVTPQMIARMAGYLGCSGTHRGPKGELMPCSSHEELMRISNRAEPRKKKGSAIVEPPKRRKRRGVNSRGYEPLGERGVLGIETLPGGGLVSAKTLCRQYELIDLKSESYTRPELRERIKNRILAGSRGGKPGQWSARKAQLLALEYRRAGGGYRGGRKKPQRSLDKWTREDWTTSDGKPAIRDGGTTRYLPRSAWEKLTPAQRAATNRKKRQASRTGRQFVANTARAREAGREARNSSKSVLIGRANPRVGDPDVFDNIDAARLRARTLGCIGVARRLTPDGTVVWTPCTNVSDYRRRTGVGEQANRDRRRGERDLIRRIAKKDADFYGPSENDLEVKALGRRLGSAVRGTRRKLRPAAFDRNAQDADGDGLVQEGTTQERPSAAAVAPNKPAKLTDVALIESFAGKKKKPNKPKPTAEERAAKRAEREAELAAAAEARAEKLVSDGSGELDPLHPKSLLLARREKVKNKYGDISDRDKAVEALQSVFPNVSSWDEVQFNDVLTPIEQSFVESALDLGERFPKTAASIDKMTINSRLKTERALAAYGESFEADFQDNSMVITREIRLSERLEDLVLRHETDVINAKRRGGTRYAAVDHLVNDDNVSAEEFRELIAGYVFAHEFGHAWHGTTTWAQEVGEDVSADDFAKWTSDLSDEAFADLYDRAAEKVDVDFPNIPADEREFIIRKTRFETILDAAAKSGNRAMANAPWQRDGLSGGQYRGLKDVGNKISKYGSTRPEEAIAEWFAASEYLGVKLPWDPTFKRFWEYMGKRKSADTTDNQGPSPLEFNVIRGETTITFDIPLCSGQFSDPRLTTPEETENKSGNIS